MADPRGDLRLVGIHVADIPALIASLDQQAEACRTLAADSGAPLDERRAATATAEVCDRYSARLTTEL